MIDRKKQCAFVLAMTIAVLGCTHGFAQEIAYKCTRTVLGWKPGNSLKAPKCDSSGLMQGRGEATNGDLFLTARVTATFVDGLPVGEMISGETGLVCKFTLKDGPAERVNLDSTIACRHSLYSGSALKIKSPKGFVMTYENHEYGSSTVRLPKIGAGGEVLVELQNWPGQTGFHQVNLSGTATAKFEPFLYRQVPSDFLLSNAAFSVAKVESGDVGVQPTKMSGDVTLVNGYAQPPVRTERLYSLMRIDYANGFWHAGKYERANDGFKAFSVYEDSTGVFFDSTISECQSRRQSGSYRKNSISSQRTDNTRMEGCGYFKNGAGQEVKGIWSRNQVTPF